MRIAKAYAIMDKYSLPHLTRLSNENGYVLPNGSDVVFKFVGIPARPQNAIPVHIYVNEENKKNSDAYRIVVRIRNSSKAPDNAPLLRCGDRPEGECLVKCDVCLNLIQKGKS